MPGHRDGRAIGADGVDRLSPCVGALRDSQATTSAWLPSARQCDVPRSTVIRIQEWPAWADNERDRLRVDHVTCRVRWSSCHSHHSEDWRLA
ncbi:hypothetical protein Xkhy_13080 [Xanthomonas axonopodis pv. khayae]|nr:hypothetical protein CIW72_03250 [Xanthomonas citri pv. malvacearum]OOW68953.1 hypothetical protein Xmar_05585 [Xanthomonas axonopodis pv. martyniicola]OOW94345.1 hypothetical protein Xvtf_20630 [Xanthomonas campestris pv. vitistrifoliae]OOW94957.1 hypothetical protein Xvtr_10670 [Xanthomonas campestris pv. vitiscarnosae]OOW98126.1 hypothetical protein Xkhy_13080 [Xanthomonas axonopodis pv. khayae]